MPWFKVTVTARVYAESLDDARDIWGQFITEDDFDDLGEIIYDGPSWEGPVDGPVFIDDDE
jgi:hypothetical protein